MKGPVLLAAGGTGGHLFPAEALAQVLTQRGVAVDLASDRRAETYGSQFPAEAVHIIPSATFAGGPGQRIAAAARLGLGLARSVAIIGRVRPSVAVGFGGYPTLPPMFAAALLRTPTIIHEANAVLGRANRLLSSRVTAIAAATEAIDVAPGDRHKVVETGNPVRASVRALAGAAYPELRDGGPVRVLVFGGSQGARYLSDAVPAAIALLPVDLRGRIRLVQQCRAEDLPRVRAALAGMGVEAELAEFFRDLPARIAASHLVISRSGASTVTELAVIGRPAIMIPLPHALDQDQRENARILASAGGGWMFVEKDFPPERMAAELSALLGDPSRLRLAAGAALKAGRPDAVDRLADLVERVAGGSFRASPQAVHS